MYYLELPKRIDHWFQRVYLTFSIALIKSYLKNVARTQRSSFHERKMDKVVVDLKGSPALVNRFVGRKERPVFPRTGWSR